ncbi:hypothetical protein MPER_10832, partial [Moniliophthora perniciosa FA553]
WRGKRRVCLKVLRTFATDKFVFEEFYHEALIWAQLHHPNILPFVGVNEQLFAPRPPIDVYVRNIECNRIFASILPNHRTWRHQGDFGLALAKSDSEYHGFQSAASSAFLRGSTRWLAPEYLDPSLFHSIQPKARDVYAFGCTIYEMYSADFWQLIEQCWAGEPETRISHIGPYHVLSLIDQRSIDGRTYEILSYRYPVYNPRIIPSNFNPSAPVAIAVYIVRCMHPHDRFCVREM